MATIGGACIGNGDRLMENPINALTPGKYTGIILGRKQTLKTAGSGPL
jgi:hypothetical protein